MAEIRLDISEIVNRAVDKLIESGWRPSEWIPCSERLPEKNCRLLVSTEYKTIRIAYYSNEQWYPDGYKGAIFSPSYVLAWTPIPDAYEPPESEVQEDDER